MPGLTKETVLVFGAAGGVGGYAALEAEKLGCKVYLAMRDTSKKLSIITPEQEAAGDFTRVQADLTDPESVRRAVETSGATSVFTYSLYIRPRLGPSAKALKEAGVKHVVLMSTYVIPPELKSAIDLKQLDTKKGVIAFLHAGNEIDIEDNGMKLTALRSGFFGGNPFAKTLDKSVSPPRAFFVKGNAKMDMVDPRDIGRVAGTVLAKGYQGDEKIGKEILYLVGPKLHSYREMWETINRVYQKDTKIVELPKQMWVDLQVKGGIRPLTASQLGDDMEKFEYDPKLLAQSTANFQKILGQEPAGFEDFLQRNSHLAEQLK